MDGLFSFHLTDEMRHEQSVVVSQSFPASRKDLCCRELRVEGESVLSTSQSLTGQEERGQREEELVLQSSFS